MSLTPLTMARIRDFILLLALGANNKNVAGPLGQPELSLWKPLYNNYWVFAKDYEHKFQ